MIVAQAFAQDAFTEIVKHVPVLIIRTIISFLVVMAVVRWTGKRSISNLAPFDLAMVIMIGEVAAIPVSDLQVDFLHGILPVALIGGLHVFMTTLNLHWKSLERLTEGNPTLLIKDGRILKKNLLKERVSLADLKTALRHKDVTQVSEVQEAWIEHAGGISVILKRDFDAATPRDVERAVERVLARRAEQAAGEAVERALAPLIDRAVEQALRRLLDPDAAEAQRRHAGSDLFPTDWAPPAPSDQAHPPEGAPGG